MSYTDNAVDEMLDHVTEQAKLIELLQSCLKGAVGMLDELHAVDVLRPSASGAIRVEFYRGMSEARA